MLILLEHGHSSFHADEVGTISFPYLTLALKGDDESTEEHKYEELEEGNPYLIESSKSTFEKVNISDTHDSNNESKRGKGKNSFLWRKNSNYIKTP